METRYELFSHLIASIYRDIQKIEREEMVQYGFRGAYAQYLAALRSAKEALTSAQLAEITGRDKAAVSRVVTEMEEKGLIRRETAGENLYRAQITLTEEGRRAADFVAERAKKAVLSGGSHMNEQERTLLYRNLDQIAKNLTNIAQTGLGGYDEGKDCD